MAKKKEKANVPEVKEAPAIEEKRYSKSALVSSVEFIRYRDLLRVLLADGEMYTVSEAKNKLNSYLNMEV